MLRDVTIPARLSFRVVSFELDEDPAVVASAAPGEQPWKALLIQEGVRTTDGRMIVANGLGWRSLPLTLGYQGTTPSGFNPHGDADASGRIETLERVPGRGEGIFEIRSTGVFTADEEGRRAAEAVRSQKVRGVSADVEVVEIRYDVEIDPDSGEVISETEVLESGNIMGAIITPHPAFADAAIEVDGDVATEEDPPEEPVEDIEEALAASASRGISSSFFEDLVLDRLTPFTVEEIPGLDGSYEILGHIAPRNVCHLGLPGCRTVPLDQTGYSYFHTKGFETTDLGKIGVGVLTMGGRHTDLDVLANTPEDELRDIFENMETVVGFVRAGHDAFGVWVHGVTRMGITPEAVELLNASNPSGEWKPIKGKSALMRVHNVPTGAFPVPRVITASALYRNGEQIAYVSSGVLRDIQCDDDVEEGVTIVEPMVASAVRTERALLSIVERLDRIERTQAAQIRFTSYDLPEKI
jgi:hypothetical protein